MLPVIKMRNIPAQNLEVDNFGIPILPKDTISLDKEGLLNATVHLFTDITPGNEQYVKISIEEARTDNIIPPFYYTKPDPQGRDPRDINNIVYHDEKEEGKLRKGYVLLTLLPTVDSVSMWGMRNHLHKPITKDNPGLICAVQDKEDNWSTRTYFESENIRGINNEDILSQLI